MSFTATTAKSFLYRCRIDRKTNLPIRPKPLIATRVVIIPPLKLFDRLNAAEKICCQILISAFELLRRAKFVLR